MMNLLPRYSLFLMFKLSDNLSLTEEEAFSWYFMVWFKLFENLAYN